MKLKSALIFTFSLILALPVYAVDGYIGLGIGQSEINQGFFGEYGDGYKLFGGIDINKNLAIEAAYLDFGNPSENLFGVETQYEARAIGVWAKGLWPVTEHTELFGKVGLANWEIDKTATVFGLPSTKTTSDGTDFAWGLGARFNHWESFAVQVEYEDIEADPGTITLWSVSVIKTF